MELKWRSCFRLGVTVGLLLLAVHYWTIFVNIVGTAFGAAMPLLLGCVIAYVVNILMSFFEQHFFSQSKKKVMKKFRRPACILLAFLSIVVIVGFVVRMIVPELINCMKVLTEELPKVLGIAFQWLEDNFQISSIFKNENSLLNNNDLDLREVITKTVGILFTGVSGAMGIALDIVSSAFSMVVAVLVALIFTIYLLSGKEKIAAQIVRLMKHYLPEKSTKTILYVLQVIDRSFHSFIVGQCIEAVILGLLCTVGMILFQLPYAAMIGCLIGFTALIPVAGAYIGAIVGAFMIITVSPAKAVIFVVFLVVLQQFEGNFIYPHVVGSSIGLPGIWVFVAVTIGGGILGIGGMLIGVPLAASIYQLLKNDIQKVSVGNGVVGSDVTADRDTDGSAEK